MERLTQPVVSRRLDLRRELAAGVPMQTSTTGTGADVSFRAIYKCDICREDTLKENLMGCRFSDMRQFKLSAPESTDGIHICIMCLDQLREQLGPKRSAHKQDGNDG